MIISKQQMAMVAGGLAGGYLSDDEGFGTLMGIGVGVGVGAHWKIVEPDYGSIVSYKHVADDGFDTPLSPIDENIKRFKEDVKRGMFEVYDKGLKTSKADRLDVNDIQGTWSKENFFKFLKDPETTKEDLIKLKEFLEVGETISAEDFDMTKGLILRTLDEPTRVFSAVESDIWASVEYDERFTTLKDMMERLGHSPEEAEKRATLLMENQKNNTTMEVNYNNNTVKVGDRKIRISAQAQDGVTQLYSDGNSIYAGRRLNMFGEFLAQHVANVGHPEWLTPGADGRSMFNIHTDTFIESLGLKDTKSADVIKANMDRWLTVGMSADELEMLTAASPKLNAHWDKMTEVASKGREFLQEESGLLRMGQFNLQDFIQNPTQMLKDESTKTSIGDSFIFKRSSLQFKESALDPEKAIVKGIDTQGDNSSLTRAISSLSTLSGIDNIKGNVGINDVTQVNMLIPNDPNRIQMSPAERGGFRSRGSTPFFSPTSDDVGRSTLELGRVMEDLVAKSSVIPTVLGNMQVQPRISLDQDAFNEYGASSRFSLGDGFGYGRLEDLNAYRLNINSTETIQTRDGGNVKISARISNILEDRAYYGVGLDDEIIKMPYTKEVDIERFFHNVVRKEFPAKTYGFKKDDYNSMVSALLEAYSDGKLNANTPDFEEHVRGLFPANDKFQKRLENITDSRGNWTLVKGEDGEYIYDDVAGKPEIRKKYPNAKRFNLTPLLDKIDKYRENLGKSLDDVYDKLLLSSNSQGHAELMSKITDVLSSGDVSDPMNEEAMKAIRQGLKDRNKAIRGNLAPDEALGIDEAGRAVRVPTIAGENIRLKDVVKVGDDYTFQFLGDNQVVEGATIKYFNPGSKANLKHLGSDAFNKLKKLSSKVLGTLTGVSPNVISTDYSVLAETGTTGQKGAYKFLDVFKYDDRFSTTEILDHRAHLASLTDAAEKTNYVASLGGDLAKRVTASLDFSEDLVQRVRPALEEIDRTVQSVMSGTVTSVQDLVNIQASGLWGVAQAMNAVSEGKATMNSSLGFLVAGQANAYRVLAIDPTNMSTPESNFLDSWVMSRGDAFRQTYESLDFDQRADLLWREATSAAQTYEAQFQRLTGGQIVESFADGSLLDEEMIKNFRSAYLHVGLDYMFSQARPDETAYGGTGKGRVNMSHFAVQAFKSGGMTDEMLDHFAKMDDKTRYDFNAFMKMGHAPQASDISLNQVFSEKLGNDRSKIDGFLNAVAGKDPEQVKVRLREMGYDPDKSKHLMFDLGENFHSKTGIRSIPIYLTSTNYGGFTEASGGTRISSSMNNLHWNIVRDWVDFQDQSKQHLQKATDLSNPRISLESRLEDLQKLYNEMFTSKTNAWGKQLFSRQTENSIYAKVVSSGEHRFNETADMFRMKHHGVEGQMAAGFHSEDIRKMLGNYLGRRIKAKDLYRYIDDHGVVYTEHIRDADVWDKGSRKWIKGQETLDGYTRKNKILPMLNWREPTYHGRSVVPVVMQDESFINKGEVVISVKDREYTKLMLGDMDDDHIFFASAKGQMTDEQLRNYHEARRTKAQLVHNILPMVEGLGVKGADKGAQFDMFNAHKQLVKLVETGEINHITLDEVKTLKTPEAVKALETLLNKYDQSAMEKASLRKVVTPFVTNMIVDLLNDPNNAKNYSKVAPEAAMFARTIGGYVVEDVIKAAHLKTGEGAGDAIQKLLGAYDDYTSALNGTEGSTVDEARAKWNTALADMTDNMTAKLEEQYATDAEKMKIIKSSKDLFLKAAENPSTTTANSVMAITAEMRKASREGASIGQIYATLVNSPLAANLPLQVTDEVNAIQTMNNIENIAKSTVMQNIKANKVPLAIGGVALAFGAIMSQGDPDFDHSNKGYEAHTEMSGMTLAGNTLDTDGNLLQRLGRENTDYILPPISPEALKERALEIHGGYSQPQGMARQDMNTAIFGNNISMVRLEQYNSLY